MKFHALDSHFLVLMSHVVVKLLIAAGLLYAALCGVLFFLQRSLIYFPQPRPGNDNSPTMNLPVDGADLVVIVRSREGPEAAIYFGGNAESVAYSLPTLSAALPNHALYLLNYRGYGGSTGQPSEAAIFADALALFDRVRKDHERITVIGRSLGSGVAAYVASRRPTSRLVLVTPYDSIEEIAAAQFPYFPVRFLARDKFESWRYAASISAPTLLIAAERDEVIPRVHTERLLTHFRPGVATMKVIVGAGHNTISDSDDYVFLLRGVP